MEVYGTGGTMTTVAADGVLVRLRGSSATPRQETAPPLPLEQRDSLAYLAAVLHGKLSGQGDLSALDTNMVVMQILTAARESAQTGRTVALKPLPGSLPTAARAE